MFHELNFLDLLISVTELMISESELEISEIRISDIRKSN